MELFARSVPRLVILLVLVAAFCLIPPQVLACGPDLCLWRRLFHLQACPGCGSTRALAAFFHGRFREALGYNRNVLVSAPGLLALLAQDLAAAVRRLTRRVSGPP